MKPKTMYINAFGCPNHYNGKQDAKCTCRRLPGDYDGSMRGINVIEYPSLQYPVNTQEEAWELYRAS